MTQKITLFLLLLLLAAACQNEKTTGLDPVLPVLDANPTPLEVAEINNVVLRHLNRHDRFSWDMVDAKTVWSATVQSDSILCIGYRPADEQNIDERLHQININSAKWRQVRDQIINLVLAAARQQNPGRTVTLEELLPFGYESTLPVIDIKVSSLALVEKLRTLPEVRYVEPMGYAGLESNLRSSSGCDVSPNGAIPAADFTTVSPSAKVSWHLQNAKVPTAWSRSTGRGITVALLDTGTSPNQSKLNSEFNSGESSGRTHNRLGFYVSSWFGSTPDGPNDQCGHGTQMAGLIAAPRSTGGAPLGVAYNCNLVSMRVTSDVIINGSSEKKGTSDGLVNAGNNNAVRIISMSIGDVFSSGQVADAVRYAYGKGKMIFAAAGTSLTWTSWWGVIFPANMAECIAVTGVKDGLPLSKCSTCHDGSDVEFVAVMQRSADNNRTALTLALSGNVPANVGGSSAATATTAGIAALVWSANPSLTRAQVYSRLQAAGSYYPNRNGNFGWGIIDAAKAVGAN